jgi:hypothetical protein
LHTVVGRAGLYSKTFLSNGRARARFGGVGECTLPPLGVNSIGSGGSPLIKEIIIQFRETACLQLDKESDFSFFPVSKMTVVAYLMNKGAISSFPVFHFQLFNDLFPNAPITWGEGTGRDQPFAVQFKLDGRVFYGKVNDI